MIEKIKHQIEYVYDSRFSSNAPLKISLLQNSIKNVRLNGKKGFFNSTTNPLNC